MQAALLPDLMWRITLGEVVLYRVSSGEMQLTVTVGQTRPPHDKEGEWDLTLLVDEEPVFLLSFTVVPGWAVGSACAEVALISRLQGVVGRYPQIKLARKALADVAPNALLLSALQGIATALGIAEVASVRATDQTVYRQDIAERLRIAYDEWLGELGMSTNAAGFLISAVPLREKPITQIKRGHKIRTREKRAVKADVMAACHAVFLAGRA